ncbi:MAG: 4'-phosphopantetheinyl transferase superfamily protein [Planctomycetes bacterium]|nr:4'-phosphopantetheinyl transferase superfamily protein [Planctomycetota bacterium]
MEAWIHLRPFVAPEGITTRELAAAKSRGADGLLREAMAARGLEPWVPSKDARGKPLPQDGWHVSKSHCADGLAVGLARAPLGVDLETIRWARVATWDRVIDERERDFLGDLEALQFTRLWTAKEAALKVTGAGIADLSKCRLAAPFAGDRVRLDYSGEAFTVHQLITDSHVVSVTGPGLEQVHFEGHLLPE